MHQRTSHKELFGRYPSWNAMNGGGSGGAGDEPDGLTSCFLLRSRTSFRLCFRWSCQCVRMLEVFRRSIRRVIGDGYEHRETLEGCLDGGAIKKALAKLEDSNDWTRHRQHSQCMINRPACIRTSNLSLPCSNVQQLRSTRYPIPESCQGNLCDLRSVNQVPYRDEATVSSTGTVYNHASMLYYI